MPFMPFLELDLCPVSLEVENKGNSHSHFACEKIIKQLT